MSTAILFGTKYQKHITKLHIFATPEKQVLHDLSKIRGQSTNTILLVSKESKIFACEKTWTMKACPDFGKSSNNLTSHLRNEYLWNTHIHFETRLQRLSTLEKLYELLMFRHSWHVPSVENISSFYSINENKKDILKGTRSLKPKHFF